MLGMGPNAGYRASTRMAVIHRLDLVPPRSNPRIQPSFHAVFQEIWKIFCQVGRDLTRHCVILGAVDTVCHVSAFSNGK